MIRNFCRALAASDSIYSKVVAALALGTSWLPSQVWAQGVAPGNDSGVGQVTTDSRGLSAFLSHVGRYLYVDNVPSSAFSVTRLPNLPLGALLPRTISEVFGVLPVRVLRQNMFLVPILRAPEGAFSSGVVASSMEGSVWRADSELASKQLNQILQEAGADISALKPIVERYQVTHLGQSFLILFAEFADGSGGITVDYYRLGRLLEFSARNSDFFVLFAHCVGVPACVAHLANYSGLTSPDKGELLDFWKTQFLSSGPSVPAPIIQQGAGNRTRTPRCHVWDSDGNSDYAPTVVKKYGSHLHNGAQVNDLLNPRLPLDYQPDAAERAQYGFHSLEATLKVECSAQGHRLKLKAFWDRPESKENGENGGVSCNAFVPINGDSPASTWCWHSVELRQPESVEGTEDCGVIERDVTVSASVRLVVLESTRQKNVMKFGKKAALIAFKHGVYKASVNLGFDISLGIVGPVMKAVDSYSNPRDPELVENMSIRKTAVCIGAFDSSEDADANYSEEERAER